jgi:hypothetical protein
MKKSLKLSRTTIQSLTNARLRGAVGGRCYDTSMVDPPPPDDTRDCICPTASGSRNSKKVTGEVICDDGPATAP